MVSEFHGVNMEQRAKERSLARLSRPGGAALEHAEPRRANTRERLATDPPRPTQTFSPRTPRGKNSQRFAKELPNNRIKARLVGREVAQDLFNRGLSLPSGTAMTVEDPNRVIDVIIGCRG